MPIIFSMKLIHISLEIWGCIFSLIMALCLWLIRSVDPKRQRLLILLELSVAVLLGMDAFAWAYRGGAGMSAYIMVRVSNFLVFLFSDLILLLYHAYVCSYICESEQPAKYAVRRWLVYGIGTFAMLMVCLSQITGWYYYFDANNLYHRSWLHPLAMVLPLIGLLIDLSLLIQYRKKLSRAVLVSLVSYTILPVIGSVLLIFYYGISLVNLSICISSILIFIVAILDQNRILLEKEREVYDLRVTMMLSQIRPHFIYNTLTTIKYLCKKDPEQAAETVDQFSNYLRGNIDSLTDQKLISFTRELEHVKNYLAIEKKRFEERLQVVWKIEQTSFNVPPLVLQPLVENAVKHGIMKKVEGGTITISTYQKDDLVYLVVEDDGVGYDARWETENPSAHVGIRNTRSRLESMCGGSLKIEGTPGKGTKVVICIPLSHMKGSTQE